MFLLTKSYKQFNVNYIIIRLLKYTYDWNFIDYAFHAYGYINKLIQKIQKESNMLIKASSS